MDRSRYLVSDAFYSLLLNHNAEPILIVNNGTGGSPRRMFIVKYILGTVGENSRPIFKSELTGYDYEQQIVYPTQKVQLDRLQSTLDSFAYGSSKSELSRVDVENTKGDIRTVRVIISDDLVSEIVGLYQFAW